MNSIENSQNQSANDTTKLSLSSELQKAHDSVDEVLTIMRENIDKVVERDVNLHDIDEKADALIINAEKFYISSVQVRRKMSRKNMKVKILLGLLGASLLILIFFLVLF